MKIFSIAQMILCLNYAITSTFPTSPEDIDLSLSKVVNNTTSKTDVRPPNEDELKSIYAKFESEYNNLSALISSFPRHG